MLAAGAGEAYPPVLDDTRANNTDETHYLVDIVQCDGRRDLNLNANSGDAGDIYPSDTHTSLDANSTPNRKSYDGSDSGITVSQITRAGNRVSAHVANTAPAPAAAAPAGGAQWLYNQRIVATYADHSEQFAWANVQGLGWRQIRPGASDGITNLMDMCNSAVGNSRTVHVYVDATYLHTAYLL